MKSEGMNKLTVELHLGDCLSVMAELPENSVDTIITDPPYGLEFMGKDWDRGVPGVAFWEQALRVAKPGAMLLAMGGTRTFHRLVVAIEDAGWIVRDSIAWLYGQGFPKSADLSKMIDKQEYGKWTKICHVIDEIDAKDVLEAWKKHLNNVKFAEKLSPKNLIGLGWDTQERGFVPESVVLQVNQENSDALAVFAELNLTEAHHMLEESSIALKSVDEKQKQSLARFAESQPIKDQAKYLVIGIVPERVKELLKEKTKFNHKAEEALRTYCGNPKSLGVESISALCVEVIDDLKHIILNQSKTFQNLGTTRQMECASAINVIITEYIAECLITFTVDTLKAKGIDKQAGADRKTWIEKRNGGGLQKGQAYEGGFEQTSGEKQCSAPSTPAAQLWHGWGTALKPAMELICVAMKPIDGTYVNNALTWGVAGLWIDGGRVGTERPPSTGDANKFKSWKEQDGNSRSPSNIPDTDINKGRFPANVILSYPEDEYELRDDTTPEQLRMLAEWFDENS